MVHILFFLIVCSSQRFHLQFSDNIANLLMINLDLGYSVEGLFSDNVVPSAVYSIEVRELLFDVID